MQQATVGAFFPRPVKPDQKVAGYGADITFGEVILPEKLG
jgi:hypothetical protein